MAAATKPRSKTLKTVKTTKPVANTVIKRISTKKATIASKKPVKQAATRRKQQPAKRHATFQMKQVVKRAPIRQKKQADKRAAKRPVVSAKTACLASGLMAALLLPQLALLWRPLLGVYATVVALAVLLVVALHVVKLRKLAIAAAILPITMLVSLSLPQIDAFDRTCALYTIILAVVTLTNFTFGLDEPLGFEALKKKLFLVLPLMIVIGEAVGAISFGMLRHTYDFHGTPTLLVASVAITSAIAEETLFRGLIQAQAARVFHPVLAVTLTSVAYMALFIGTGSVLPAVFAAVAGLTLSAIYAFKQNLVLTTTANAVMKLTYLGLMATFVLR